MMGENCENRLLPSRKQTASLPLKKGPAETQKETMSYFLAVHFQVHLLLVLGRVYQRDIQTSQRLLVSWKSRDWLFLLFLHEEDGQFPDANKKWLWLHV